jgi:hypothetical protein
MLLSIAICPLVNAHWWEKNMAKVSAFWALVFFLPFLVAYGSGTAFTHGVEVMLLDYVPFILLLFPPGNLAGDAGGEHGAAACRHPLGQLGRHYRSQHATYPAGYPGQ